MRRRHVVGLIALLAGAAALTAGPAYAKEPKPSAFLEATPVMLPSGGTTTLTIRVEGAKECTLSANKEVAGLPVTFPCESGTIERKLTMPANRTQGPLKYRLKLRAINAEGRASHAAKARVSRILGLRAAIRKSGSGPVGPRERVRGGAPEQIEEGGTRVGSGREDREWLVDHGAGA